MSAPFDPRTLFIEDLEKAPPMSRALNTRYVDHNLEEGWVKSSFDIGIEFGSRINKIHGGAIMAMLDETSGVAVFAATEGKKIPVSIDIHTHFLRAMDLGRVYGIGRVTKVGRQLAFMEGHLENEDGKICARCTASAMLIDTPPNYRTD